MKHLLYYFLFVIILLSCKQQKEVRDIPAETDSDKIYQYSVFTALANKVYDGNLTVG
jgi:hypothetical protein